jgi:type VI secretion system secreted protein Hcp
MAIFMNFDDKKVKGNVTADGYDDWIEVTSLQFGVGRGVSMEAGNMSNREATRPSISEMTFSKQMDASSSGLFAQSVAGDSGVKVVFHVCQTGAKKVEKYAEFELEDCIVSSYSMSASESGAPYESISLSFSKIMSDLAMTDKTNKNGTPIKVGYDLAKATPL